MGIASSGGIGVGIGEIEFVLGLFVGLLSFMKSFGFKTNFVVSDVSPPNVCRPVCVQSSFRLWFMSTRLLRASLKCI